MSSLTPRLSLELPDSNDSMKKGDAVLASNYRIIDQNMHVRYESDLATITSPYKGQFALDTDIDEVKFYDSGWKYFGSNGTEIGRLNVSNDRFTAEGSDAPAAGTPVLIHQTSSAVAIVAGRRYQIFLSGNISPSTATNHNPLVIIKASTINPVTSSDTTLFTVTAYNHSGTIGATKSTTFTWAHYFTSAAPVNIGAGNFYFGVFLDCNNGTATDTYRAINSVAPHHSTIIVRDVGV